VARAVALAVRELRAGKLSVPDRALSRPPRNFLGSALVRDAHALKNSLNLSSW